MEAVPKLPMLVFDLRTCEGTVEFGPSLKEYIRQHYGEDPTLYESAITGIESLRREVVYPSRTVKGCAQLKRYYCQLQFMSSRFPMKKSEEVAITYSWKSLHSKQIITQSDISLEMASILYNIGALHIELGAMENRSKSEGMKIACTHFQCAAWPFQVIIDEYPFSKSLGLPKSYMSFLSQVCLAQAQECILEKSMLDNRKSAITAKVAVQVVDFYKQCVQVLSEWPKEDEFLSEVAGMKNYKKWYKYLQFKVMYYESISLLYQGQQAEDQQKMGERVAFYQAAFDKIEEAAKFYVNLDNPEAVVNEAITFVHDVIEVKRRAAKNENEFIYHVDVPLIAHLPKLKGASLVKGIPFNINDPEVCGHDLFSDIVPMKAHESASLYSEEKAKLLRRLNGQIESKDEELETFLSMLDLDEIKTRGDVNKLPQELIDRCASLSAKPEALTNLTDAMNKLADIYQDVESMLTEIKELLKEEEDHEKEYQQTVGKRPPTIAATDLTREAKKYQEAHAKASESNQTLHKAMVMHLSNFKLLTLPLKELMQVLPVVSGDAESEAVTKEMLHLISKVDEMKRQRVMLADQLRDMVCKDDITKRVVTYSGPKLEDLFQEELKKYDKVVSLIEQNLAAQENILKALKETYARYGATRKNTSELHRKRAAMISSLITSYDAYDDLISKSSKGLDFYKKLETNVSKLLQRVKGTCKVQEEEREQMLKSVKKSESGTPPTETPSLKLKDYLNIKKETGKLSLEPSNNMASSVNSYYNDPTLVQQSWVPSVRPAPVGSEETDTTFKGPSDSFRGFYQGPGKDQIWSNTFYSAPQSTEQKLKFHLPPNPGAYQGLPGAVASQQNQDIYPISSYSTTLPKVEGQAYEPKSNYYDIHGSPNRCYNPSPSYPEAAPCPSTGTVSSYAPPDVGYPQSIASNIYSQNSGETSSYYNYGSTISGNYSAVQNSTPQPSITSYPSSNVQPESTTNTYGSSVQSQVVSGPNQVSSFDNSITFPQNHFSYSSTPGQIPYSSTVASYVSPQIQSSTPNYGSSASDQSSVSNSTPNYQNSYQGSLSNSLPKASLPVGYQVNFSTSHDPVQNYQSVQSVQTYPTPTTNPVASYMAPVPNTFSFGQAENFYVGSQGSEIPSTQFPTEGARVPQSWATSYNSSPHGQQYFQSGNESLYTASQNPNTYTMTNSDVYKSVESQGFNYSTDSNYGGHYYTSQYGQNCGGQAEMNSQNGNPVTYMQAGNEKQKAVTTTTFSNSEAKSSPVTNPSNVDLLAGLDFNISHSPLTPETTTPPKKEEPSVDVPAKSKTPPKTSLETLQNLNPVKDSNLEKIVPKDLMANIENAQLFVQDVEKYEKFVEGLTSKTLNGPTPLDLKWKEIVDLQEKVSPLHIISVARCYPMKNRFPDILPYDDSRVELPSTKDDYINASRMMDLTKFTPPFILTQAPLPSTYSDFWAMVFEQQVEVVVCLLSDTELDGHVYFPSEKGQELEMGKLKISLQSSNVRSHWVERILSICVMETRATRVVVHLQFTAWPGSSFPESPGPFLSFSSECINFFTQQRSYNHPVVVHCISGVGRTGLFCLIIASILDIQAGKGIPDLVALTGRMCQFRKSCLRDREHLKFAYQIVLYYCQDFLMKRGILTNRPTFEEKKSKDGKCHTRHPSEDFLGNPTSEVGQVQAGMERLDLESRGKKQEPEGKNVIGIGRSQSRCSSVSRTSSGRSSPSSLPPDILTALDSVNFSLKIDPSDKNQKKKKFTPEDFNKNSTMDSSKSSSDDPLSKLDPLWTMKK